MDYPIVEKMEDFIHTRFVYLSSDQLENMRKASREDYENLSTSSLCCSVITQTLQQLQILKENYEDGVLSIIKIESEQVRQGLDKIFQGLEKHVKLQDDLRSQYEDINNLHHMKTSSYPVKDNFVDVKQDTSNIANEHFYYDDFDTYNANSVKKEMWNYDEDFENADVDSNITNIKVEADICDYSDNNEDYNELEEKPKQRVKASSDNGPKAVYECEVCQKTFNRKDHLTKHKIVHSNKKEHVCSECNKAFSRKDKMKRHLKNIHGIVEMKSPPKKESHECEVCGKVCPSPAFLIGHRRLHTGERPFKCDQCDKDFRLRGDYLKHLKIHTGIRPYVCDICGKTFNKCASMRNHKVLHSDEKPFSCDECGKRFKAKRHLHKHMRIHTDIKNYACSYCEKKFRDADTRNIHEKQHTGERPFSCDQCDKTFIVKSAMRIHQRCHTGARPYKCELCTKAYSNSASYSRHMLVHSGIRPHACDQCDKTFVDKTKLKIHLRIHTGEKPFSCDLCGKTFRVKGVLIVHQRGHTGDHPYKCEVCGKGFATNALRNRHTKTHDKGKTFNCEQCGETFTNGNQHALHKSTCMEKMFKQEVV